MVLPSRTLPQAVDPIFLLFRHVLSSVATAVNLIRWSQVHHAFVYNTSTVTQRRAARPRQLSLVGLCLCSAVDRLLDAMLSIPFTSIFRRSLRVKI